jgi:hypothetical protein
VKPADLVAELHRRQGEMYAGGSVDAVAELLAEDIVWHVPGTSPIADGEAVVQLVDGSAELDGETAEWRTAGVYRVDTRVREVWLVPLDLALFDRIWSSGG